MSPIRKQAREAANRAAFVRLPSKTNPTQSADAASRVWAKDYEDLADLLADETIAPLKRIDSAIVWIKETIS